MNDWNQNNNKVYISNSAPTGDDLIGNGQIWVDTTGTPYVVYMRQAGAWVNISTMIITEGTAPPTGTTPGNLFVEKNSATQTSLWMRHSLTEWMKLATARK
jgi:hypothetical protein